MKKDSSDSMLKLKKYVLVFFITALVLGIGRLFMMPHFSSAEELSPINTGIPNNLEERGKQLRAAINRAYEKMRDAHAIKPMPKKGDNDISFVVIQYIPLGTSFDDAEHILRSAGFKVEPRPAPNSSGRWINDTSKYDVVASIDPYISSTWFGPKTSIYLHLTPHVPGDYTKILGISASILLTFL